MTTLAEAATPRGAGDRYQLDVPAGWRQGRGAFGGLVIGALVRATERAIDDPSRIVRSITAEIPGPVEVGPAEIAVEVLRAGNAVTTARAALVQHGKTLAHAVVIAGANRRDQHSWQELAPPSAPPWRSIQLFSSTTTPEFADNFEYRLIAGVPGSGDPPVVLGWIRARDPGPERDAAHVVAMADAWWPSAFTRTSFVPGATIAYTLDVISLPPAGDGPLLYRGSAPICTDGYVRETRELWTEDGHLIAVNHQTIALI